MKNRVNPKLEPVHLWHGITRNGFDTRAMNVHVGVLISHPAGVVFVPGLYVCKRWQVKHIEAGKDEETGVRFEAHDVWSVEVALVSPADCANSSQGVDDAIAEHRKSAIASEREALSDLRRLQVHDENTKAHTKKMLTHWVSVDEPLPSLKAAGINV